MLLDVPVIDVAPFRSGGLAVRRAVADEVGRAVNDIGFLVITGHGIDPELVAEVQAVSNAFFDLPEDEKRKVLRPAPDVTRGYIPLEAESVGRSQGVDAPGDLNESLMIGPVDVSEDPYYTAPEAGRHFHPILWPAWPEALRPAYEAYFRAMGRLAEDLMAMFAVALDLPEPFFADKIDRHISRLRVRNYPAPTAPPIARGRALRLRLAHDPTCGGQAGRAASPQSCEGMGRRSRRARQLHHQHRRTDGAVDE